MSCRLNQMTQIDIIMLVQVRHLGIQRNARGLSESVSKMFVRFSSTAVS
jgi:hypothetical protein